MRTFGYFSPLRSKRLPLERRPAQEWRMPLANRMVELGIAAFSAESEREAGEAES